MSLREAKSRVTNLVVVRPSYERYRLLDSEITAIASQFTPLVEPCTAGHCFLDVSGSRRLFGAAADCAAKIRSEIVNRIGVRPSVALAVNKTVSKVGSRVVRSTLLPSIRERALVPVSLT